MQNNPFFASERTFLITGAASGIGRATSILLSKWGVRLILIDINQEGLLTTAEACCSETYILPLDLLDSSAIKDGMNKAVAEFGKINGFVHLAGIPYISPLKTINATISEKVYKINSYAAVELAKNFASKKMYSGEYGSIVLISSVYGLVGSAANIGYAVSKGAIQSATKALAIELANRKIRVNCIAPGFIKTNMMDDISSSFSDDYTNHLDSLHPLGLGEANDVANSILFLLSDLSQWITGAVISVDGGFTAQ